MSTTTLTKGKTYFVSSTRKGKFTGELTHFDDTWATVKITDGKAGAMLPENARVRGEEVTVRREWCVFTAVPEGGLRIRMCEGCRAAMPKKARPQTCPDCGHVHARTTRAAAC